MMTVIGCIVEQHDLRLVLVAAIICGSGSWAVVRLFLRAADADGRERAAWVVLTAFVTGASIWCTHFVAMLGYEPGLPIGFDPVLTIVSLLVAMIGSATGLLMATAKRPRAPLIGGTVVGLSIAVMHYTGMLAYRVQGIVSWDSAYLAASIAVSCAFAAAALHAAVRVGPPRVRPHLGTLLFFLSIVGLHFTGMTAFRVSPMLVSGSFSDPDALNALAFAVACVGLTVVGSGFASSFIDTEARAVATDALANMSNGLVMFSATGKVTLANDRVRAMFGLANDELAMGTTLDGYVEAIGRKAGWDGLRVQEAFEEHRRWLKAATITRIEQSLADGTLLSIACQPVARGGAILTYDDVTETRNGEKTMAHMAFHDALTGLKNRRMFAETIDQLLRRGSTTMLMIDLDRFKGVNDRLGHAVGDDLLRQVATRIEACLHPREQAFRLGGDELAILGPVPLERAVALARDVGQAIALPFEIGSHVVAIGCSLGIAAAADGDDASAIQQKADLALYAAKNGGRNRFEIYQDGMLEQEATKRVLEDDLTEALAKEQFELWYQPLYALPERRLTGFEALIRWRHPKRGLIAPSQFIPVAEQCGLITSIGAWVIDAACRQAALWPDDIYMSINVSAVQLRSAALVSQLTHALTRYRLPAARVEIEITETAMVENSAQIILTLSSLRAIGVRIAMDDFGTGYSSLAHIREFQVDRIKIDRSFIAASEEDAGAAAIVRAVVSMARELNIDTTAEGIEEERQLQNLSSLGCGTAQGYLLGRPVEKRLADAIVEDGRKSVRGDACLKSSS